MQPFLPLAASLAIGLLIGLERGWHERNLPEGTRVAGVRTFTLIGLFGGFAGLLSLQYGILFAGIGLIAVCLALAAGYISAAKQNHVFGVTSLIAGLVCYLLGVAAVMDHTLEAVMAAVVTALVLGYKSLLHRWINAIEAEELQATLILLTVWLVVLPILPNRAIDPWGAINPFEVWWMVVLIASVSFLGYVATKIFGAEKGVLLTGLFAGLASSTALTLHYARLSRHQPQAYHMLAAGTLIACGTMLPRILLVGTLINSAIFSSLLVPVIIMGGGIYGAAFVFWLMGRNVDHYAQEAELRNPLGLSSAFGFGALLVVILLAATYLEAQFGDAGIMAISAVSGIADVDAITLALAQMSVAKPEAGSMLTPSAAGLAIIVAVSVNNVVKAGLAGTVGKKRFAALVAAPLVVSSAAGLTSLLVW